VFPQQQDEKRPMWDSGVRKALKLAAEEEGCDFAGLGLHTLRRANITWRQEVGGSSIEASQIAGHANSKHVERRGFRRWNRSGPRALPCQGSVPNLDPFPAADPPMMNLIVRGFARFCALFGSVFGRRRSGPVTIGY
jgi:hypothetical protein